MWFDRKNRMNHFKDLHDKLEELGKLGGLRIWILHVLDDGPKNGVEIMDSIQEHHEMMIKIRDLRMSHMTDHGHHVEHFKPMKNGPRRPSPGSVYPMLKKMVSEGKFLEKAIDEVVNVLKK